ncbi:hypothetical protein L873DRAFT_1769782 [Choiromyces venosus 120613-1]|uniref:Uncharacterized protein n=1 Tax=Choiromyces venosus 120613-1 TaxID=1336337 RepID=A0A3N4JJE3_9PEZI|nr:hypothetical protein L873DRAFT_1769782 [Choiromyces venosus 120613-1]
MSSSTSIGNEVNHILTSALLMSTATAHSALDFTWTKAGDISAKDGSCVRKPIYSEWRRNYPIGVELYNPTEHLVR